MGTHPINLAFRFLLELSALASLGTLGWVRFDGPARWLAMLGLPLLFAALWGTFAVPDDPSRSGSAPVAVPGMVRLGLELALFAAAAAALHVAGFPRLAVGIGMAVAVHYGLSYDRIAWLLAR